MKKIIKIENSCAILALHYVSGLPEDTVIRVCKSHDFDPMFGMSDEDWIDAAKELGIVIRMVFSGSERLGKFFNNHKEGLFLIRTHDHLFVIDNGFIADPGGKETGFYPGLGRLVKQAWKVTRIL